MKKKIVKLIFGFLTIVLITACNNNKFDVDVSNIDVKLNIVRFDKDLFAIPSDSLIYKVPMLKKKYGQFFDLYCSRIVPLGGSDSRRLGYDLQKFVTYSTTKEVVSLCNDEFSDISSLTDELTNGFKHFKYYFADRQVPDIYTCISSFNYAVASDENKIIIGLDMYLGNKFNYKQLNGWHNYMRYKTYKKRIAVDCMGALANMEYEYSDSLNTLLSQMIHNGKINYFINAMLPDVQDSILMGYSQAQLDWSKASEQAMWAYLVEHKLLFSTKLDEAKTFIYEAPFSKPFTRESPGRIGIWFGWQIVKSYMEHNEDVTLPQLMKDTKYHELFNKAKYQP